MQKELIFSDNLELSDDVTILSKVDNLLELYKSGALGGEFMPEDHNPGLDISSNENYLYFTLPMALNFQRNSYTLWKSALDTFNDESTKFVFSPEIVVKTDIQDLRKALTKHKVALQPNKHVDIWYKISSAIYYDYENDLRNLFTKNNFDVELILGEIRNKKKQFPYLNGPKIGNYWLYVMSHYSDCKLLNKDKLSIAPDTHIMQSSIRLGLIDNNTLLSTSKTNLPKVISTRWKEILDSHPLCEIDIHTPLWLWSRKGFIPSL